MSEVLRVTVCRVLRGDENIVAKPVFLDGFTPGIGEGRKIPHDGFIIRSNFGGPPLYVRDSDLQSAIEKRNKIGHAVPVAALAWEKEEAKNG